jgi:hypothetical protein
MGCYILLAVVSGSARIAPVGSVPAELAVPIAQEIGKATSKAPNQS